MRKRAILIRVGAVALAMAIVMTCAPAKQQPAGTADSEVPYDFKSEGEVPAVVPATPTPDVEESAVVEAPLVVNEGEVRIDSSRVRPPTVPGFRIQLYASLDPGKAEAARLEAEKKLGMPVYVQVIDRMYKVRVGDCASRPDAEKLLEICRKPYPDAWVVDSPILLPSSE